MKINPINRFQNQRQAAMLPLVAVTMILLFVACVFAIDVARIHVTRSELRTATDAAAKAAVEALGRLESQSAAVDAAIAVARNNRVAGQGLELIPENIQFGMSTRNSDGSFSFVVNGPIINSVEVVGERSSDSPQGPVAMMFGPLFGRDSFSPQQSAVAMRQDLDVALVLDKSGSMGNFGRFPALLNAIDVFLDQLDNSVPEERVSLTAYDTFPRKLVDMTDDLNSISDAIENQIPAGLTGIGQALQVGIDSIQNDPQVRINSTKAVILMTDGNHNLGVSPEIIARQAAAEGIIVHTITFSRGANQELMKRVADITGGTHLHAENNQELIEVFEEVAKVIQVLLVK